MEKEEGTCHHFQGHAPQWQKTSYETPPLKGTTASQEHQAGDQASSMWAVLGAQEANTTVHTQVRGLPLKIIQWLVLRPWRPAAFDETQTPGLLACGVFFEEET